MLSALLSTAILLQPVSVNAERTGAYLVLQATINGKPCRLLVDSGAGMNVLTTDAAKRLGIEGGTSISASGAGTKSVPAKIVKLASLKVGNADLKDAPAVVVELPPVLQADGLIGHGFLSHWVTKIDYEKATFEFTKPDEFKAPADFTSVPLRVRGNIPEVKMSVEGVEGWVKVDTGASDALTLFDGFVTKQGLREKFKNLETHISGFGVGGPIEGERTRVTSLKLAGNDLPPFTIMLSRQKTGAFADNEVMGNLGADILRRFTVIFDYAGSKAYFKRNANFDTLTLANRSGAAIDFDGKTHRVLEVLKGSPAEKAGLVKDDVILAIDGKMTSDMRALEVWSALRRSPGTHIKLLVQGNDGKQREIDMTLQDF
jgi:clan AA aspartic protease (TIGR02281 family)